MFKRILLPLAVASVTALWACQSDSNGSTEELSSSTESAAIYTSSGPRADSSGAVNDGGSAELSSSSESSVVYLSSAPRASSPSAVMASAPTEFEDNAFPPTLPSDDDHSNGWLRTDCLLCHESGIQDAPLVQHSGMSELLLSGNCRSCHVVVAPEAEPDDEFPFARNAFPPTLPTDDSHSNAWLRDDCTLCHENAIGGAPIIVHKDMARLLLKSRCRSCHLPRVASEELVPDRK